MIVYEHALLYCWWPVCTVSSSDMLWRIVLFSTRISLFDTTVLTLLCRWRAGQGISYVYIPFTSLPLYYVYICLYTVFWDSSPHTRLYVWPAFCLFLIVYVDNSRELSTSSLESGVEVMHSRSRLWSTEPTCRYIYISCTFLLHDRLVYSVWDVYWDIIQYPLCIDFISLASAAVSHIVYHLFIQFMYILIIIFCPCEVRLSSLDSLR